MIDEIMRETDGVASGDDNGKIELREFLAWYGKMLKTKRDTEHEDVEDVFRSLGGSLTEGESNDGKISKADIQQKIKELYDLDVDVDEIFPNGSKEVAMADFTKLLLALRAE